MKNTSSRAEIAKVLFAQNPTVKSFHMTSDDQAFHQSNDARNHAKTLDDQTVDEVFKNSQALDESKQEVTIDNLKIVINAAGVTDDNGKLVVTSESTGQAEQASATGAAVTKPAAKGKAAVKASTKKPAEKKTSTTAKEPIKPVEKTSEKEVVKTETLAEDNKDEKASADTDGGADTK